MNSPTSSLQVKGDKGTEGCKEVPQGQHKDDLAHNQAHKVQVVNPDSVPFDTPSLNTDIIQYGKGYNQGKFDGELETLEWVKEQIKKIENKDYSACTCGLYTESCVKCFQDDLLKILEEKSK
jgi:hypothetical protein